jgi:hypothetical protein
VAPRGGIGKGARVGAGRSQCALPSQLLHTTNDHLLDLRPPLRNARRAIAKARSTLAKVCPPLRGSRRARRIKRQRPTRRPAASAQGTSCKNEVNRVRHVRQASRRGASACMSSPERSRALAKHCPACHPGSDTRLHQVEDATMWRTSQGERTLEGAEAELFCLGVVALTKQIRGRLLGDYFSRMTPNERLCALAHVARALLVPSAPCPENRAWRL